MIEFEVVKKKLRHQMNELADLLAGGNISTMEDYRHITGKIYGLAMAESIIIDYEDKQMEEELSEWGTSQNINKVQ